MVLDFLLLFNQLVKVLEIRKVARVGAKEYDNVIVLDHRQTLVKNLVLLEKAGIPQDGVRLVRSGLKLFYHHFQE